MSSSNVKMRFAMVNGEKHFPEKGLCGICPLCGADVVSKCGYVRIPHWAHKSFHDCDSWSEGKTDWHIQWQDKFPKDWQEVIIKKDDLVHRADICIPGEDAASLPTVVEFQHSYLEQSKLNAREEFYPNLIWVVDASGRKRDRTKFLKNNSSMKRRDKEGRIFSTHWAEEVFPSAWVNCKAHVFFDFADVVGTESDVMYCLLPNCFGGERYVLCYSRGEFLASCMSQSIYTQIQNIINLIIGRIKICRQQEEERYRQLTCIGFNRFIGRRGGWRSPRL